MPQTVVITGAAGGIGRVLQSRLAHVDRILRFHDRYEPLDDSEAFAATLTQNPVVRRIGGEWCDVPLGEPY